MCIWVACWHYIIKYQLHNPWISQLRLLFLTRAQHLICYQEHVRSQLHALPPASFTCRKQLGMSGRVAPPNYRDVPWGCCGERGLSPKYLASTYSDNELYFRTLLMVRWFKVGLQGVEGITTGKWKSGELEGRLPQARSMHKDERTKVKVAPTNQSDNGCRAELSWQVNNCDGGNGLNRAQRLWTDFCAVLSPDIDNS